MKLSKHFPKLKERPAIKKEILKKLRNYEKTKIRDTLFEPIKEKKVVMNERGFCVRRELN